MNFFAILLVLRNKSSETTTIEISSDIGTKWGVTVTNSMSAIKHRGPRLNIKTVLSTYGARGMVISMLKIRRPLGRLIFNMGIAIPGKTVFLIETAPKLQMYTSICCLLSDDIQITHLLTISACNSKTGGLTHFNATHMVHFSMVI